MLIQAMADINSAMGQPFARQIATNYLVKLRAHDEKGVLDAEIAGPACKSDSVS